VRCARLRKNDSCATVLGVLLCPEAPAREDRSTGQKLVEPAHERPSDSPSRGEPWLVNRFPFIPVHVLVVVLRRTATEAELDDSWKASDLAVPFRPSQVPRRAMNRENGNRFPAMVRLADGDRSAVRELLDSFGPYSALRAPGLGQEQDAETHTTSFFVSRTHPTSIAVATPYLGLSVSPNSRS